MKPEERRRQAFDKRAIYPGWRGGKPLTIEGGYCCPCNQNGTASASNFNVGKRDRWTGTPLPIFTAYSSFSHTSSNEERIFVAFGKDSAGNSTAIDFSSVKEIWLNMGASITGYGLYNYSEFGVIVGSAPLTTIWAPLWIFAYAITSPWAVPASGAANQIAWGSQPNNTWKSNSNSFINPATNAIDNYVGSLRIGEASMTPDSISINDHGYWEDPGVIVSGKISFDGSANAYGSIVCNPAGDYNGQYAIGDAREQIVRMEVSDNAPLTNPIYGLMFIAFTLDDLYNYGISPRDSVTTQLFILDQNNPIPATWTEYYDVVIDSFTDQTFIGTSGFPFDYSLIPSGGTAYEDMQYATMGYNITNDKALLLIPASC